MVDMYAKLVDDVTHTHSPPGHHRRWPPPRSRQHGLPQGLQLEQLLASPLGLSLVGDLLALQSTAGLLLQALGLVAAHRSEI